LVKKNTIISKKSKYLVVIGGPTASGKTDIAIEIAQELDSEIISADSRQVYREMSIGTAKPSNDELTKVKHHLIDHISITQEYSVGQYERDVIEILDHIYTNSDIAVLTGGTGLYINAIIEGIDHFPAVSQDVVEYYTDLHHTRGIQALQEELRQKDPAYSNQVDINNPHRLIRALSVIKVSDLPFSSFLRKHLTHRPFAPILICLERPRAELYDRINNRVDQMIAAGLIDEVSALIPYRSLNSLNTVGYKEIFKFLDGEWSLDMAITKIKQHSRNYAKRQITWFKNQQDYKAFSPDAAEEILAYIKSSIL